MVTPSEAWNATTPRAFQPCTPERLQRDAHEAATALKFARAALDEAETALFQVEKVLRDLEIAASRAQRDAA